MQVPPKYTIDVENQTCKLDLYIGGLFITSYVFENNNVLMEDRPNTDTFSVDIFEENLNAISNWIGMVSQFMSIPQQTVGEFNEDTKKTATHVDIKMIMNGTKIVDSRFTESTGDIEFKPRDQQTINYSEFVFWYIYLRRYLGLIKDF